MLGVGVIGLSASGWASFRHAEALSNPILQDHVRLVAVATSNPKSALAATEKYGVIAYGEDGSARLIKDSKVDLVVVAVKLPLHALIIEKSIDEGKDLFVEWPLTTTLREAEHFAITSRKKGIRTVVGLQTRYTPSFLQVSLDSSKNIIEILIKTLQAEKLVKTNAIGRILSSCATITGDAWGPQTSGISNEYMEDVTAGE